MKKIFIFLLLINFVFLNASNKIQGENFSEISSSIKENILLFEKKEDQKAISTLIKNIMNEIMEISKNELGVENINSSFYLEELKKLIEKKSYVFFKGKNFYEIEYLYNLYLESHNIKIFEIGETVYDKNIVVSGETLEEYMDNLKEACLKFNYLDSKIMALILEHGLNSANKVSLENNTSMEKEFLIEFNNKTIDELFKKMNEEEKNE
jgi:hypothetical protein